MRDLFQAFARARRYTKGVSKRTEGWYWQSWHAFESVLADASPETLTKSAFTAEIETMLSREVSPITINTYARAINAFLHWLSEEGHCPKPITIPRLKEPDVVIPTLKPEDVQRLLQHRPTCKNHKRAQMLALLILDTGLRLKEALSLRRDDIDLDNLLLTVKDGKGGKQRLIPIGASALQWLRGYLADVRPLLTREAFRKRRWRPSAISPMLFLSKNGAGLEESSVAHWLRVYQRKARIRKRVTGHVFRHTLATEMLRAGADLRHIQEMLGHEQLNTTQRYLRVVKEELKRVHQATHPREQIPAAPIHYRGDTTL